MSTTCIARRSIARARCSVSSTELSVLAITVARYLGEGGKLKGVDRKSFRGGCAEALQLSAGGAAPDRPSRLPVRSSSKLDTRTVTRNGESIDCTGGQCIVARQRRTSFSFAEGQGRSPPTILTMNGPTNLPSLVVLNLSPPSRSS
jgi:hypothetical protein